MVHFNSKSLQFQWLMQCVVMSTVTCDITHRSTAFPPGQYFTRPFVYHTGKVCVEEEEGEDPGAKEVNVGPHPPGALEFNERDLLSGYSVMSMSSLPQSDSSSMPGSCSSSGDTSQTTPSSLTANHHNMFQSYADIGASILHPAPPNADTSPLPQAEACDGVVRSVLMMVPLRLGNERFNPCYWEGLKVKDTHTHRHISVSFVMVSPHPPRGALNFHNVWGSLGADLGTLYGLLATEVSYHMTIT